MSEPFETEHGYIIYEEYLGLKLGDIVQLKPGGPEMTITNISKSKEDPDFCIETHCEWFEQHPQTGVYKKDEGNFHPATLKKIS